MNIQNISLTPIIVLIIQGLLAWVLWSIRHAFVREEDYAEHVEQENNLRQESIARLSTLEGRLLTLSERITLLPDATTLNDLGKAVESLRGDLKALDMRITGLDRLMQSLERTLDRQEKTYVAKYSR